MKDDKLYLIHIQECIDRIEAYTIDGKDFFASDTKTQDAVLRNLHILSESTQRISAELKSNHPEIDWKGLAGFRNMLVHDYLGINIVRVWEVIERFLPVLKRVINDILKEMR
ncbi:MAG: DUF86 domain-containing protein [Candidatus Latescibacter sp.]|nr:DUF86 domain-containing protein [Candidatus Latescibacter sp.]